MLSKTSLASRDFFTMTSFSRTAVCMRRTLDWFLGGQRGGGCVSRNRESWTQYPPSPRRTGPLVPGQPQASRDWAIQKPQRSGPRTEGS